MAVGRIKNRFWSYFKLFAINRSPYWHPKSNAIGPRAVCTEPLPVCLLRLLLVRRHHVSDMVAPIARERLNTQRTHVYFYLKQMLTPIPHLCIQQRS